MSEQKDLASPPDFLMQAYAEELPPDIFLSIRLLFALRGSVQRVNADLAHWLGPDALSPGRLQMLMILWAKARASKRPRRRLGRLACQRFRTG